MALSDPAVSWVGRDGRVVRVLVDVPAIDKTFDYLLPDSLAGAGDVRLGTIVRVPLHGRRVGAWVVGLNVTPAVPRADLLAVAKVSSFGPPRELLALAKWAGWRWWGRPATFLRIASPPTVVRGVPMAPPTSRSRGSVERGSLVVELDAALARSTPSVVRYPPRADHFALVSGVATAVGGAGLLVLAPLVEAARDLARRLRRAGFPVAFVPDEWARATVPGMIVIGARTAAWAPCATFGAAIVLDEHDEAFQDERAPTWHAREVVAERARRLGVPCLLVSAVPSPQAVDAAAGFVVEPDRRTERAGWPIIELVDRTTEEPGRVPIVAPALTSVLRGSGRVVCVLNRSGRARLLDCRSCRSLIECEHCGSAMSQPAKGSMLECGRCGREAPSVCRVCGGGRLRQLRPGTARLRDDLEALAGRVVAEVVGDGKRVPSAEDGVGPGRSSKEFAESADESPPVDADSAPILVGTEAVLHRAGRCDTVVFLDIDGELLAPRMRALDGVVALVIRAARLVGPNGRVLLVTRQPEHPVLRALALADAASLSDLVRAPLAVFGYAPPAAIARVDGAGAAAIASQIESLPEPRRVIRVGPPAGPFLITAASIDALADTFAEVVRPPERVRVEIDPARW